MGIGLAGALLGGVLTLLSPCSVMLLPAFFSYAFDAPAKVLGRTGVFTLGLMTTLVPLGALAGSLGALVQANRFTLVAIASGVVIVLGLVQLLGIPMPAFLRVRTSSGVSALSVYLLGTVYGLAGVCAGPILGAVLAISAFGGNPWYGALTLAVFAIGMAVPLLVISLLWGRSTRLRQWLRPREIRIGRWRNTWTQVISGLVTIALGVLLLLTEGTTALPSLLGASEQAELEQAALRGTAGIPDAVVIGIAIAALVAVWAVHRVRRRRAAQPKEDARVP